MAQIRRFIYVPRDDLCDADADAAVVVYETKNANFPKLVGECFSIKKGRKTTGAIYREYAIKILAECEKIRTTKSGKISSKNIDLRCLGD